MQASPQRLTASLDDVGHGFECHCLRRAGIEDPGNSVLGEGNAYGPGQGSSQKLAFASHATLSFAGAELGDQTVAALPLGMVLA